MHEDGLEKIRTNDRELFGFPLNFSFTSMESIINGVKSTQIWYTNDVTAKFAVGVRAFPYSEKIISVWVYVACECMRK